MSVQMIDCIDNYYNKVLFVYNLMFWLRFIYRMRYNKL